jgi:threonine/homoserine/homoserine lactone efflux protein
MIPLATLSLFVLAVLALQLSPGPNMAFVLSHGVAHGPRGGFAAAAGIATADLVHTLFAATGITALVAAWAPAFDLIRYAGVGYLVWLAAKAVRAPRQPAMAGCEQASTARIFRMAMINCLLNPKALLFFMVFLPQFVDAGRGNVLGQIILLGVVLSAVALIFNALLGGFSGRIGTIFKRMPGAAKLHGWMLAVVLLGLALRLVLLDRPAH